MTALNYRKDYVVKNKYSRPGMKLPKVVAFVIHYTANPGANAKNHQSYFDGSDGGGGRYAGAHIFVDKDEAVEIIPLNEVAYHANDKSPRLSYLGGNANFSTIGIEMCIEKNGTFHKDTVDRTVQVVQKLHKTYPNAKVIRHYDVTGKNCPKPYVEDTGAWKAFLAKIGGGKAEHSPVPIAPKPSKPATGKKYTSLVDYLKANGKSSSFSARKELAKDYGMSGYSGTAAQNTKLLDMLQGGVKPAPSYALPNAVYRANRPYPSGSGVRAVQQALASVYFYPNKGAKNNGVDGVYGPNTADAVKRFQSMHGLTADGIYGPNTRKKLEREMK